MGHAMTTIPDYAPVIPLHCRNVSGKDLPIPLRHDSPCDAQVHSHSLYSLQTSNKALNLSPLPTNHALSSSSITFAPALFR